MNLPFIAKVTKLPLDMLKDMSLRIPISSPGVRPFADTGAAIAQKAADTSRKVTNEALADG